MRFALTEAGLSSASWVAYQTSYSDFDMSSGGDGLKTIWVEYKDEAGNIQTTHTSDTTIYDTTAESPVITTNSGNDYSTPDSSITLSGTCASDTVAIYVNGSTDGVTYTAGETSLTYTGTLESGENSFEITAEDAAGNVSDVDSITITYVAPIGGYTEDNVIPTAQISQSTDGDGIITIRFKIKDSTNDPCTIHTFQYSADDGNNWDAPANGDDSESMSSGWKDNSGSNYSSAADFDSAEEHTFSFNTKHQDATGLDGEDQSDVRVRFTINDGTYDSSSPVTSESFRVDNLAPTTGTITIVDSDGYTNDATLTLEVSSIGAAYMRFALTEGALSSASWVAYQTGYSGFDISSGGEGSKTIWVEYKDEAGNIQTTHASDTTIYDTTAPSSSAIAPTYENSTISVNWTASDATSGVASTQLWYKKAGGTWADTGLTAQTGTSGTFPYSPKEGEGTYYFASRSTDNVGNVEEAPSGDGDDSTIYDITLPEPPVITTPSDVDYSTSDSSITLSGTCASDTVAIYVNGSTDGVTYTAGETSLTYTGTLESGENSFEITAEDAAGNVSDVDSITITYVAPIGGYTEDNVIPTAQISQSTDGDGIITIRFKIKDSTNDPCTIHTFQYSADDGNNWDVPANGDDSESMYSGPQK